ncbi:MAG TPA: tyrosine-protein phosphatase [Pseudomonadales bacterium]|nr:tyrosine-protein phosphatase [Pseudomonadales bacterium]
MKRILDVPGAINLRDFGGYQTNDGRSVRSGLLYRSGMLAGLTDAGRAAVRALDVEVICDLRRDDERSAEPTPFPSHDPRQIQISIDPGSGIALREEMARTSVSLEDRIRYMVEINRELVRDHVAEYRRMFDVFESVQDGAFLIHCAAGKDRTGFGVAAILFALGVPRETIVEDYLLTNIAMDFEGFILPRLKDAYGEIDIEAAKALSGVRLDYIEAALGEVDATYGSFEAYLDEALGVDASRRAALQARYLE